MFIHLKIQSSKAKTKEIFMYKNYKNKMPIEHNQRQIVILKRYNIQFHQILALLMKRFLKFKLKM